MKKRLLTLLLALALAVSLALPAAAAQSPVEVSSALELAQAMAEPVPARGRFRSRAAAAEPTRVVAFAPALADGYGADRVLHLAAWLLLAYWIVKFLLRLAVFFAPVLLFILAVYILFH